MNTPIKGTLEERAIWHYKNNSLAKTFVDILAHQIGLEADRLIIVHSLAHAPLLMQLDMGLAQLEIKIALEVYKPKAIFP